VYGDLVAVDTVTYPEIDGEYMYVEKVKEKYTKHTRTVTKYKTVNGKRKSYTTTETYWTWDRVGSEDKKCNEVTFCGITFNVNKFDIPSSHHIDTIKETSHIRYIRNMGSVSKSRCAKIAKQASVSSRRLTQTSIL
jgi:hypothetical protein